MARPDTGHIVTELFAETTLPVVTAIPRQFMSNFQKVLSSYLDVSSQIRTKRIEVHPAQLSSIAFETWK